MSKNIFLNKMELNEDFQSNVSNIVSKLMEKCIILIYTNERGKKPFIIFDKIVFGDKNITYEELISYKENLLDKELAKNFLKFLGFLNEFEENIKKDYINNFKLEIIRIS